METAIKWLMLALIIAEIVLVRAGLLDATTAVGVVVGIEILLLLVAGRQIIMAVRRYRRDRAAGLDLWMALEDGLAVLLPRKIARIVALEPRLWGCLGKWLFRRDRLGEGEFPYHKRSQVGTFLVVVLFTTPVEVLLLELLIPWTWPRLLLIVAAVYMLFWAFGFYASLVVLPHRLEPNVIHLRYGALADGKIPYGDIALVKRERLRSPGVGDGLRVEGGKEVAYIVVGGRTDVILRLKTPHTLDRLLGPTDPVTTVHVAVDDPEWLAQELGERMTTS